MRALIRKLYDAQQMLQHHVPGSPVWADQIDSLRATVPAPLLAHFMRLAGSGSPGVALVRHGVCSACHIRVPSAVVAALAQPKGVHLCNYCGSYLLLPESEIPLRQPAPAPPPPRRRGRPARAALAV
jgi:predicted  nucleic acid-binding Zn-ribbon protein